MDKGILFGIVIALITFCIIILFVKLFFIFLHLLYWILLLGAAAFIGYIAYLFWKFFKV